ncbi:MAG: hypothetical protein ACREUA_10020 [Burkholderiales bacterium]
MARACISALWLYHDYLDESHKISQSLNTREGSYWHAILHRREGDHSNSKYWFARTGSHPVYTPLWAAAKRLASNETLEDAARFLADQPRWQPETFVDLCRACVTGNATCEKLCREVQRVEWGLLFDYCYRHAIGK